MLFIGTLGGIAGGLAEIGWIGVYGIATGTSLVQLLAASPNR
jgi:hypothetical protein